MVYGGNPVGGGDPGSSSSRAFAGLQGGYGYVYFQGDNGGLWQKRYTHDWNGDLTEIIPPARVAPNTPVATLKWGGSSHFRVYYLSENHELREWCWDSDDSKYDGALNSRNVQAASDSKISAIRFRGNIRVYYQNQYHQVCEEMYSDSNGWETGSHLGGYPKPGTSLAFVNRNDEESETPSIRGYHQTTSGEIQEYYWEPHQGWSHQVTLGSGPDHTPIAATALVTGSAPEINVFWLDSSNYVLRSTNHYGPTWTTPSRIDFGPTANGSKLDAKSKHDDGGIQIAVFTARSDKELVHRRWWDNKWQTEIVIEI